MIGELGGITKVIMFVFGFFLYPISEHSFTLKALKKLYLAKSKDPILLKSKKDDQDDANSGNSLKTVHSNATLDLSHTGKPKNIILSTRQSI